MNLIYAAKEPVTNEKNMDYRCVDATVTSFPACIEYRSHFYRTQSWTLKFCSRRDPLYAAVVVSAGLRACSVVENACATLTYLSMHRILWKSKAV